MTRAPRSSTGSAEAIPERSCTTRMEEALDDPELDAVAIATPVSTHHALVSAALDAGKHVFVEKPLARSTDEIELMNQAEATGRVLMPRTRSSTARRSRRSSASSTRASSATSLHLVEPSQSRLWRRRRRLGSRTATFRSFGTGSARCPTRCRPSAGVASGPTCRTCASSTCATGRGSSRTSSSRGFRPASYDAPRSSAPRRWSCTTTLRSSLSTS